ncbi:hypothetical protein [Oscillatoria sp. FACHB-1406]|uniref:hypothetical protein n=1 Tax=Oscillatoria sp. FACHB-1406 TaxID=2692846 RepID=UPI0016878709|nr:hypothetical protein [Oscillatoria sp. FACHB-1406]MBD2578473.1 hypothetical protein [Oscillatoria sp. FACHB-1406]
MEIVRPTPTKMQVWHFSIDYWVQSGSALVGSIGIISVFALFSLNPLIDFLIIAAIVVFNYYYFCLLLADQSIISYCCFNKTEGMLELRRRKLLFQQDAIEIPLVEISAIQLDETIIKYSWFNFNPFDFRNTRFEWHNTNPIAAIVGFFTGRLRLYQVYFVTDRIGKISLTCYETDICRSKRKLVERLSSWLDKYHRQPANTRTPSAASSSSLTQSQSREQEIEKWQLAIAEDANNAEAHYQLGLALYRNKQRQEASFHLKQARDLFEQQNNSKKAAQIQEYLWQSGLD